MVMIGTSKNCEVRLRRGSEASAPSLVRSEKGRLTDSMETRAPGR